MARSLRYIHLYNPVNSSKTDNTKPLLEKGEVLYYYYVIFYTGYLLIYLLSDKR